MNKYLPIIFVNFAIFPNVLADYIVAIPLEESMFSEPENLTLVGAVTANKTTVNLGESIKIDWNYEKLTSIVIPYAGTFNTNSGSANITPTKSGSINVVVNNRSKSENETLPITVIVPPVEILSFISAERGISIGQKINLSWQVDNADYVEFKLLSSSASIPSGKQPNTGSFVSNTGGIVTGDVISYLLTAYSLDGENIKTATVSVPVRGSMTFNSFTINNPTQPTGIAIPLGGTLDVSWTGTNIKDLTLTAKDTGTNSTSPDTFSFSIPNPDASNYSIPMNKLGSWELFSATATGFNNGTQLKSLQPRVFVYQPATLNSFTINGSTTELTVKKGWANFAWSGQSPTSKYVLSGFFADPVDIATTERSLSLFYPYVGDYNVTLTAIDYNGRSVSKNIVLHFTQ